jgi:hypothetical protein
MIIISYIYLYNLSYNYLVYNYLTLFNYIELLFVSAQNKTGVKDLLTKLVSHMPKVGVGLI